MFRDSVIAAIRTGVAALVGFVIAFLVSKGFTFPDDFAANLNVAVLALSTAAYNWLVILLEKRVHPYFGYLLGVAKAPTYDK